MSKIFPISIAIVAFALLALAYFSSAAVASSASPLTLTQKTCSGTLGSHTYKYCGPYDALELQSYLSSTNPSGYSLFVGYCGPIQSDGTCQLTTSLISAGHYGPEFQSNPEAYAYSVYINSNPVQVSFSGTDYIYWN